MTSLVGIVRRTPADRRKSVMFVMFVTLLQLRRLCKQKRY